jgi:hypothetical protein
MIIINKFILLIIKFIIDEFISIIQLYLKLENIFRIFKISTEL